MKMTKEEFLEQLMTRREAENYVGLSSVAFQHHLRQGTSLLAKNLDQKMGKSSSFGKKIWTN